MVTTNESPTRMIRVLTLPDRKDLFLARQGDEVTLDVPGGRVTFALNGGWSESGTTHTRLTYEPIRSGLVRFGEGPQSPRFARQPCAS